MGIAVCMQVIGLPLIRDLDLIKALPTNGIYTLIVFVSKEIFLTVGKLSQHRFPKGYYTYTGSALGKGASSLRGRISRHLQKKKRNFWHIDFLLANENTIVIVVVAAQTKEKLECTLNSYIKRKGEAKILAKEFGAYDCKENCKSHLLYFGEENIESKIVAIYSERFGSECIHVNFDCELTVLNALAPKLSNSSSIEYKGEVEWVENLVNNRKASHDQRFGNALSNREGMLYPGSV